MIRPSFLQRALQYRGETGQDLPAYAHTAAEQQGQAEDLGEQWEQAQLPGLDPFGALMGVSNKIRENAMSNYTDPTGALAMYATSQVPTRRRRPSLSALERLTQG